jgi:DNA-binding response OmpR family regulator
MRDHQHQPTTTVVAILGADTVVENALAQLLEGEGYSTRVLKSFPMGEAVQEEEEKMPLGGVDLVVLAPSLSTSECEAFLAARRATSHRRRRTATSPIPVIVLCSPMKEAPPLLEEEEAARSVSWPTTPERLVSEIEAALRESSRPAARREKSFRKREDEIPR